MKKKLGWIILVIVMIVFIGGASVLYNKYSKEIEHQNLVTDDSVSAEEGQVEKESVEEPTEESAEEPER